MIKFPIVSSIILTILTKISAVDDPDTFVKNVCYCVPISHCNVEENLQSSTNIYEITSLTSERPYLEQPDGTIEMRIMNTDQEDPKDDGNVYDPNIYPVTSGMKLVVQNQTTCRDGLELCCPTSGFRCGLRYPPVANAPVTIDADQASYGAYPWQVTILTRFNEFIAAGVLIDHRHVLTAAHKIFKSIGDWSINPLIQPFLPQEVNVSENNIIIHPNYTDPRTVTNDVAILRTNSPGFSLGSVPTVGPICLPNQQLYNQRCWTTGWGLSHFSSEKYQTILKEVNIPLINSSDCQNALRTTRLGSNFQLDQNSFICAGGESGKDACTGDGGAGLVCSVNNRFYLVGLVAWGIGCGIASVPGVYVNIQYFIPWIQATIQQLQILEFPTYSINKRNFENSPENRLLIFRGGDFEGFTTHSDEGFIKKNLSSTKSSKRIQKSMKSNSRTSKKATRKRTTKINKMT